MKLELIENKKEEKENLMTAFLDNDKKIKLISKVEYRAIIRKLLPEDCFNPDSSELGKHFLCLVLYISSIYLIANTEVWFPLKIFISFAMGITLTTMTFFLHDLMHGSIIRNKFATYLIGCTVGMFNLFPVLFWQRIHNLHHARTGNLDDPDRSYILSEKPAGLFGTVAYKTRISQETVHPLISLILMSTGFFWYFGGAFFHSILSKNLNLPEKKKYELVTQLFKNKLTYFGFIELGIVFAIQYFFFFSFISRGDFFTYVLVSIIPVAIAHFIAMSYIHTNHFLSPLTGEIDDPLINSLSIKDSWLVDKIFLNFSHHTEHHLFPEIGSRHYPKIRKILLELYPERFQLMTMVDAMKRLFKTSRIYEAYTNFTTLNGNKKTKCLLPNITN